MSSVPFVFSRQQMLSASALPFPNQPYDSDEALKRAFNKQFEESKKSIANGIACYWIGRKSDKEMYRYHLSFCAYRYPAGFDQKWIKPYLERILGPKDEVASVLLPQWLKEAFPGFKSIKVEVLGDWDYSVIFELGE